MPVEQVIRHRGPVWDENGTYLPGADTPMVPFAIAPRGGSETVERGRGSEDVACTVYFAPGTDILSSDQLTVRGERYGIVVNDWRSPWSDDGPGGLEVLCTRGQG